MKKHVLDGYNTVYSVEWRHRDGAVQYTPGAIGCGDRYTVWRGEDCLGQVQTLTDAKDLIEGRL
ncbi:MAG: hypothetical protein RLZZ11_2020 [Cyanobacteriota bacterium]|jgi:hypothetical protein